MTVPAPPSVRPSDRAPGLYVAADVEIPDDAELGVHVVIHAGVRLGAGCVVQDGAVLGKPPLRHPGSRAPANANHETAIGSGALIGAGAVICRGATVREHATIGDHALVREGAVIGARCLLGHGAAIGFGVPIGAGSWVRNNAVLAPTTIVEEDVFIGIAVSTTDTNAMAPGTGQPLDGVTLRRGCRIGSNVTLLPGVTVGEFAVVGAGAVVTQAIPDRMCAMGIPARVTGRAPARPTGGAAAAER